MLVCDDSLSFLRIKEKVKELKVVFSDVEPNPDYATVERGVQLFRKSGCKKILAIGGGSTIDVAKCIKLYSNMDDDKNYLHQKIVQNDVALYAIPTTAGTGSEATQYAVIYYKGEKQSVTHEDCIPSVVFFDPSVLETLPDYQKKATMFDALCHATESYWSVNSTQESRDYSRQAIEIILQNKDAYMKGDKTSFVNMLQAAYYAGKAINISQTTAGHAMCYKLTSLYGIAHGHAAALCVSVLWPFMIENMERTIDPRGKKHLKNIFEQLAQSYNCTTVEEAVNVFVGLVREMGLCAPDIPEKDCSVLCESVNPVRLKNHPIQLDDSCIYDLYCEIRNL
nr:phosphonoacetaldehyde reductase [Eubacterium sp.]